LTSADFRFRKFPARWNAAKRARVLLLLAAVSLVGVRAQAPRGSVRGEVYGLAANGDRVAVSGSRVVLTPLPGLPSSEPPGGEIAGSSDANGRFIFENVPSGAYNVSVTAPGVWAPASQQCVVAPGGVAEISIEVKMEIVRQSVEVSAAQARIAVEEAEATQTIESATLESAPTVSERFESLLPLIPGVVRGPDGEINLKGTRSAQSGLLVNSVNVTDPVTGASAVNLPVDVVSTVEVLSNPYDAQYGKFAGAVTTVETQASDFNRFHFKVQNFFPDFRRREGHWAGIEAVMPRVTVSGPVKRGKLAVTQSFEYRFVRTEIKEAGLPPLARDTELESFDSYTQADAQLGERHSLTLNFSLYPQKQNYFGLNTFTPRPATPNLRQRGFLLGVHDTYILRSGSVLKSRIDFKQYEADVRTNSFDPYRLGIETTEGGFFVNQDRDTRRVELEEILHLAPRRKRGQHFLKLGLNYSRQTYHGDQIFDPVNVLGISDRLVQRITFTDPSLVRVNHAEYTLFLQDQWIAHRRLTLDLGLRFDGDSVTNDLHPAPRLGLAYLLTEDNKTVLRGGVGFFYDVLNLAIPTFLSLPARTETRFSGTGDTLSVRAYRHRLARDDYRNPLSLGWDLQLDRELNSNWFLRVGFQQRVTTRNFFIDPEHTAEGDFLTLYNSGRDRYREFEITSRYRLGQRHHVTASYVRSSALGDLNDFNSIFGNIGEPLIRPNERTRLPFDAPNRFLLWGEFQGPVQLMISPVIDVHTGFPYSVVDEWRDFVGPRNDTGQFPRFAAIDLQVLRRFRLPIKEGLHARVGVKIFNLLNRFNPLDIQNNLASSRFGTFSNTRDRKIRAKFVIDF